MTVPWLAVVGRGHHIKAIPRELIIQYKNDTTRYPLSEVRHLLIAGVHQLETSAVIQLLKAGSAISFFDMDCSPLGYIHPFGYQADREIREGLGLLSAHRYAVILARAGMKSRLLLLERMAEQYSWSLFYEGELEFLHRANDEVEFLVRMEEVRRIHRLSLDMYYEILARTLPPELGFRRRTERPHRDPVNALLSLGYALLYGTTELAVVGAHLEPDAGFLHEGAGGLVQDLLLPLKPRLVDEPLLSLIREGIHADDYDLGGGTRCHLSDTLVNRAVRRLRETILPVEVDHSVRSFVDAVIGKREFVPVY